MAADARTPDAAYRREDEWAEPHALDGCDENIAARVQEARSVVATGDEAQIVAYLVGKPVEQVRKVMGDARTPDAAQGLPPLDTEGILWVAAIDLLPIEKRIEWVKTMTERVAYLNTMRGANDGNA
jgi:hypothetical protein